MRVLVATVVGLVIATSAWVAIVGASVSKDSFQLKGEVYGNSQFKIEMQTRAGKKLASVKAGTYRIKIEDSATIHNFRLKGPGVNKATSVSGRAETIWTVTAPGGKHRRWRSSYLQSRMFRSSYGNKC